MINIKNFFAVFLITGLLGCSSLNINSNKSESENTIETSKKQNNISSKEQNNTYSKKENTTKEIVILGTADVHGRIYPHKYKEFDRDDVGGFAKVATLVKTMREEYPELLLIDLGDMYFYEPFIKTQSPSIVPILNHLEYDMVVIGNHELYMKNDYLMDEMEKFNGKAIVNNVYLTKEDKEDMKDENYEREVILETSSTFDVDGIKVALTGSSIPQAGIRKFLLSYGYDITDPLPETQKVVKELDGDYDILVGAFHLNKFGQNDNSGVVEVMEQVPEFSFAFNGHEHVDDGEWMADGKHIIANNAYGITAAYAKIQMEYVNGRWIVKSIDPTIVELDSLEADPEFMELYKDLHEETVDYVDDGFHNWEKVYNKLHEYIIP